MKTKPPLARIPGLKKLSRRLSTACVMLLPGGGVEAGIVCAVHAAPLQPHHGLPDRTVTLTLDGSVSNMFNLTGAISNQFMQMLGGVTMRPGNPK